MERLGCHSKRAIPTALGIQARVLIRRASFELEDASQVLRGGGLHPGAAAEVESAMSALADALGSADPESDVRLALRRITSARSAMET